MVLHCRCLTLGVTLKAPHCKCLTVGVSLLVSHCGCHTVSADRVAFKRNFYSDSGEHGLERRQRRACSLSSRSVSQRTVACEVAPRGRGQSLHGACMTSLARCHSEAEAAAAPGEARPSIARVTADPNPNFIPRENTAPPCLVTAPPRASPQSFSHATPAAVAAASDSRKTLGLFYCVVLLFGFLGFDPTPGV